MQVSAHAKQRMEERLTNYSSTEKPINVFKTALRYGKPVGDFVGDFRDYLDLILTKQRGTDLRVYADNVFLFEVRKKILITVWNIPEEYEPYKNYLKCNQPLLDKIDSEKLKEDRKLLKVILKEGYKYNEFGGSFDNYLENLCDSEIDVRVYDNKIYLFNPVEKSIIDVLEIPEYYTPVSSFMTEIEGKEGINVDLQDIIATRPEGERNLKTRGLFNDFDNKLLEVGYKECRRCGEVKKLSAFALNKAAADGHQSYCNKCRRDIYLEKLGKTDSKDTSIKDEVKNAVVTPVSENKASDSGSFDLTSINQVFGFSEYLRSHNISDSEFINFLDSVNKNIYEALEVYNHLSEESKDLYLKIRREG